MTSVKKIVTGSGKLKYHKIFLIIWLIHHELGPLNIGQ